MADKQTYMYSVEDDYIDVERAGRFELNGEDPETKAKAVIVSTQQVPEDSVELKKVDDLSTGVITSDQTENK